MTISTRIRGELFVQDRPACSEEISPQLIRLPLTRAPNNLRNAGKKKKKKTKRLVPVKVEPSQQLPPPQRHGLPWTIEEHERFLQGLEQYPSGPWKAVAAYVGTRTPRQTMTHAQKYRQKIQRRRRGLLTSSRQPVPVTDEVYGGLVIATNAEACTPNSPSGGNFSKSPTAVDIPVVGMKEERLRPLENNWCDGVAVEQLDAAFRAFLEGYEPFSVEEEPPAFPWNSDNSCFFKEETSISL